MENAVPAVCAVTEPDTAEPEENVCPGATTTSFVGDTWVVWLACEVPEEVLEAVSVALRV